MKKQITLAVLLLGAAASYAQMSPGPAPRAAVSQLPAAASRGSYTLDSHHASIIARIGHAGGLSYSTVRFGNGTGALDWNGADPAASKLSVTVDMTSLATPVPDFASLLIGDRFLKTGQFHDATFASTRIERTGPTTGRITGDLTFMGVTKPMTIEANLVGVGKSMRGGEVIGFTGKARFKRSDFGFTAMMGPIGDEAELILDAEFDKAT